MGIGRQVEQAGPAAHGCEPWRPKRYLRMNWESLLNGFTVNVYHAGVNPFIFHARRSSLLARMRFFNETLLCPPTRILVKTRGRCTAEILCFSNMRSINS